MKPYQLLMLTLTLLKHPELSNKLQGLIDACIVFIPLNVILPYENETHDTMEYGVKVQLHLSALLLLLLIHSEEVAEDNTLMVCHEKKVFGLRISRSKQKEEACQVTLLLTKTKSLAKKQTLHWCT